MHEPFQTSFFMFRRQAQFRNEWLIGPYFTFRPPYLSPQKRWSDIKKWSAASSTVLSYQSRCERVIISHLRDEEMGVRI